MQEYYEVFRNKPLGKGSFGEVWLAQTRLKVSEHFFDFLELDLILKLAVRVCIF